MRAQRYSADPSAADGRQHGPRSCPERCWAVQRGHLLPTHARRRPPRPRIHLPLVILITKETCRLDLVNICKQ